MMNLSPGLKGPQHPARDAASRRLAATPLPAEGLEIQVPLDDRWLPLLDLRGTDELLRYWQLEVLPRFRGEAACVQRADRGRRT